MPLPCPTRTPRSSPLTHHTAIHPRHTQLGGTPAPGHITTITGTVSSHPTWTTPPPPTRTPMERSMDTRPHHITCLQRQSPRTLPPVADKCRQTTTHVHHQIHWLPHNHLHPPSMETPTPRRHPNTPPHTTTNTSSSLRPQTTVSAHRQDQILRSHPNR